MPHGAERPHCGAFSLLVEAGVDIVDVFFVQPVLDQPQSLAEALEVDDLPGTQKFDDVVDVRVIGQPQDIVVGDAGLLLCCDRVRTTCRYLPLPEARKSTPVKACDFKRWFAAAHGLHFILIITFHHSYINAH